MTANRGNWTVLFSTMLVIGAVVLTILGRNGTNDETLSLVLRLTAWISFLIYLLVLVTRPLQQLSKSATTAKMLRNRRSFGIAFAGAHSVHLVLILLFVIDPGNLSPTLAIGATAYLLMFLMLITSFDRPARAIGPVAWRRLHKIGLYGIGTVFTLTVVSNLATEPGNPAYQAVIALLAAAIVIRILAFFKRKPAQGIG